MAYNWSQIYEQQAAAPTGNQADMQILERRSQLEAQQKQKDFENQLELLRQSADYNNATTKKRIEMEAKLFAMQKQFLPTEMAGELLGITPDQPEQIQNYNRGQEDKSWIGEQMGGLGATTGAVGGALASKTLRNDVGQGLIKAATKVHTPISAIGPQKAGANALSKLLTGAAVKVGTKPMGKIAGAVAGGIPGFLIGTAIGELISKLLEGNDEDKAKAEYLINQYK